MKYYKMNKQYITGLILCIALGVTGCKKWDNHVAITQPDLNLNLLQAISANPDLSKFREYAGLAGLDSLLQSSKTFTVWAPTNAALQTIDPATVADKLKLKAFILNHISNQQYFIKDVAVPLRIQMLSGKYNNFSSSKFDESSLTNTDKYVANGVLHTITAMVPPLQNIDEFINATTAQYAQNAFMVSLNYSFFDASKATIDSISLVTGLPVYHAGTGMVTRNQFADRVYDLKREDKQYTYFLMQDASFALEADSLKSYFNTGTTTTDFYTRVNVVKDLAYDTAYKIFASMPQTLVSKSGINVAVNNAFVVDIKKMSNGYVYVLSKLDVPTKNKFLPITLQGENPTGFLQNDKRGFVNFRDRSNPVTSTNFSDIWISGHGITTFYSYYSVNEMPSMKYQVYAKATNDIQAAFSQTIVAWSTTLGAVQGSLTHAVPLFNVAGAYDEKYLGDITITQFGKIDWRLTAITTGPVLLDYLRLVPLP